jgi:hypothetical protein
MTSPAPPSTAHRVGQVFVIVLCVIAALIVAGSWLAMRACNQVAGEAIQEAAPKIEQGIGKTLEALGNAK